MGTPAAYVDDQLGSTPRRQSEAVHLAELVRELQGEVLRRTEAAATWQARAEFLAGQLESARDEIKALAAPQQLVEAPGTPESAEPMSGPFPPVPAPPVPAEDGRRHLHLVEIVVILALAAIVVMVVLLGWPR
jgi:hypothetical protein